MLEQGIITRSKSPWMAPTVFVPKKSREVRICIDYHELNKRTSKDSYPLPLPDEIQDKMAGSTVFSTLDLHSGYWQLLVSPNAIERRQLFALVQASDYMSFVECLLGCQGSQAHFNA